MSWMSTQPAASSSRLMSRSRRDEMQFVQHTIHEPLNAEERAAVDGYVQYRLKLASHPLAADDRAVRGTGVPFSVAIREKSDRVLAAELELAQVRLEAVEEDIKENVLEQEALRMRIIRLRETTAVCRMKIAATHTFLEKVNEVTFEATKRGIQAPVSVMNIPPEIILRRARLQDALSSATDVCPTVVYPTLVESISTAVQARRKVEYEKKWSDETSDELQKIQREVGSMRSRLDETDEEVRAAKAALDEAHREVFTKRKRYIITHRRLTGAERLPNGMLLSASDTVSIMARIKTELRQGVTTTLDRLAETDCAELATPVTAAAQTSLSGRTTPRGGAAASTRASLFGGAGAATATPRSHAEGGAVALSSYYDPTTEDGSYAAAPSRGSVFKTPELGSAFRR